MRAAALLLRHRVALTGPACGSYLPVVAPNKIELSIQARRTRKRKPENEKQWTRNKKKLFVVKLKFVKMAGIPSRPFCWSATLRRRRTHYQSRQAGSIRAGLQS
jgi:membrane protein YqaA with SNARE-associated domain